MLLRVLALLFVAPLFASFAGAVERPDFSEVTTKTAARKLVREGRLVEILYFPAELGGPDDRANLGYVTPEAAEARARVIETFRRYIEDDLIDQLDVVPEHDGDSVVPNRIVMMASHSVRDGGIEMTIEVW